MSFMCEATATIPSGTQLRCPLEDNKPDHQCMALDRDEDLWTWDKRRGTQPRRVPSHLA